MTPVRAVLARGGAPAALLVAEAAWVTLLFDALANGTASRARPPVDLPYLAFALPSIVAFLVVGVWRGTGAARSRRAGRVRFAGGMACVLVGGALDVWLLEVLNEPSAERALSWGVAVSVLAWGRGTWLALRDPSARQGGVTLVLGSVIFVVVLAERAASTRPTFERATSGAGWLLFVFFVFGVIATIWLRQRDVEREALRRGPSPPGVWLAVALVPVLLVALVGFLVGGAGRDAGPAVVTAVRALGGVVGGAGHWVFLHLPAFTIHPGHRLHLRPPGTGGGLSPSQRRVQTRTIDLFGYWLLVIVGLLLLAALVFLVRLVVVLLRRRAGERSSPAEERESIFTWGHVVGQIGAMLRALWRSFTRLIVSLLRRPRRALGTGPSALETGVAASRDRGVVSVRATYRMLLGELRRAALGRHPAETPRELANRLSSVADDLPIDALSGLTALYEEARYSVRPDSPGSEAASGRGASEGVQVEAAVRFGATLTDALERRITER